MTAGHSPAIPTWQPWLMWGFGGLCFETAVLRGLGLVLGNTAASAALVVGAFVAALGLGGALAARMAGEPSGRSAARGYFATAIAIALVAWTLGRLPPLPPWPGLALALLLAGAPGLAMGYAFPRGVDPKIRDRMEQAFAIASKDPEVLDQLAKLGVAPSFRTGAAFHKYMKDMEPLFIQVLTESGMKTR